MQPSALGFEATLSDTQRVLPPLARVLIACAAAGLLLWVGFISLLALTLTFTSDARIEARLRAAAERGVFQGLSYPTSGFGDTGHRYDVFTDCIAFGMNLSNTKDDIWRRIAYSPTAAHEVDDPVLPNTPCEDLAASLISGTVQADHAYLRFWHGYQVYVRSMLSIFDFDAFMRITAVLFYGSLILFGWRLRRVFGPWSWAVVILPFFLLADFFTVPLVVTHAISLGWAFLSAALVPMIIERFKNARAIILPVFVFVAGSTYNFLNFLINPPMAPTLMCFLYLAIALGKDRCDIRREVVYAAGLALLWFAGFFTAWLGKWAYAALALGVDATLAEIVGRMGMYAGTQRNWDIDIFRPSVWMLRQNVYLLGWIIAAIASALGLLAWTIRKHQEAPRRIATFLALTAPIVIIAVWLESNGAHSVMHAGFTSRSLTLYGAIPLLAALKIWRDARQSASVGRATELAITSEASEVQRAFLRTAWAAARRATGTRKGDAET